MKQTMYSTDPKPFVSNGSFVRVEVYKGNLWGVVVNNRIVYQNGAVDSLETALNNKRYINAVVNTPFGFDGLDEEVFDWEYREVEPMPELKTGMFVYVQFNDPKLGGYGVVVGNDIIYQKGGWNKVNTFNAQTEKNKSCYGHSKITAVAWGEEVHNFNSAKRVIENGKANYFGANLWRSQD